jgi:hypothetical protein
MIWQSLENKIFWEYFLINLMPWEIKVDCHLVITKNDTVHSSLSGEACFSTGYQTVLFIAWMCVCMYFEFFFVGYNAHGIPQGKSAKSLSFISG